uniref:Metallothionein type II n=1 Tax=Fritillaria agrestis TaxID=64177 RepID=O49127_FRIAG|nr:metallothionein type II [Fritillaria agrestis]
MSSTCSNCDCADKTNCPKKGNSFGFVITETDGSYFEEVAENNPNCKCASNCTCTGCNCGK